MKSRARVERCVGFLISDSGFWRDFMSLQDLLWMLLGFWASGAIAALHWMEKNNRERNEWKQIPSYSEFMKAYIFFLNYKHLPLSWVPWQQPTKKSRTSKEISTIFPGQGKSNAYPCMFISRMKYDERKISYFSLSLSSSVNWFVCLRKSESWRWKGLLEII